MNPDRLAALYARAFASSVGWGAEDFRAVLATPGAFLVHGPHAFALGRMAADEVELLLMATDPAWRRQGRAQRVLRAFEDEARARGAVTMFLEVSKANRAARALYHWAGWTEVGRRENYYAVTGGPREVALVLRKDLP